MISFKDFANEILIVESIRYLDRKLFRPIVAGKYSMSKLVLEETFKGVNEDDENDENDDKEYTLLDDSEQRELIKTYQDNPTSKEGLDAMTELVNNASKIIWKNIWITSNQKLGKVNNQDRQDMYQNAVLAFMKAVEKYDINSKILFNGYAKTYIKGAILNTINPNRSASIGDGKINAGGYMADVSSMDAVVSGDRGEYADKDTSIKDTLADLSRGANTEKVVQDNEKRALFIDWLNTLPSEEATALKMLYLGDDANGEPATMEEIGKKIGMSKMGVKKVLDRATQKLHKMAYDAGLVDEYDPNIKAPKAGRKNKKSRLASNPIDNTADNDENDSEDED